MGGITHGAIISVVSQIISVAEYSIMKMDQVFFNTIFYTIYMELAKSEVNEEYHYFGNRIKDVWWSCQEAISSNYFTQQELRKV